MEEFTFLGDMYNDGMPLGISAAIARNFAAYNRFSPMGAADYDRPGDRPVDRSGGDRPVGGGEKGLTVKNVKL